MNPLQKYKHSLFLFIFLFNLFACKLPSIDKEVIVLSQDTPPVFFFGKSIKFQFFSDKVTFSQIKEASSSEFEKSNTDFLNLGITEKAVWMYFELDKQDEEEWVIELQFPNLDLISYFITQEEKEIFTAETGVSYPESSRFYHHPFFIFPILKTKGIYKIYFHLKSEDAMILPILFWRLDKFHYYDGWKYICFGLFAGVMLSLGIYNFLLFLSTRDSVYFYYVGYILSFFIFISTSYGFLDYILGDFFHRISAQVAFIISISTAVFAVAFTREFLQIELNFPRLNKFMIYTILIGIFIFISMFFIPKNIKTIFSNLYPLVAIFCILSMVFMSILQKNKVAYFFALSWSVFLLGVFIFIMANLGFLESSFFTQYVIVIGAALESLMLSLAIGYRINTLIKKEQELQKEVFNKEKEAHETQTKMTESFKRFVPIEFLNYLKKESVLDIQLGNARTCYITVLFMDIKGFTKLSEQKTAAETLLLLNQFLSKLEPIIHTRNGFIDKFIGDSIVALFNDPKQAVLAGLEMINLKDDENSKQENLDFGIGIHFGEVVLGTVGSPSRIDTTVIGDVVNVTSRVESLTREYSVNLIATEAVIQNLDDVFLFRELDTVQVKGRSGIIKIFEIIGVNN